MAETSSERMRRLLRDAAEPARAGELVTHAIARAARRLGWERGRTKRLWYGEARVVTADEMRAVERIAAEQTLMREARSEYQNLCNRIARLEAAMGVPDEDFARPQIDALRAATGRAHRPVDQG